MISVTPTSLCLKTGDTFVMKGKPADDRTWWQKRAPAFLGGRVDPTKDQTLVITAVTSGACHVEGNPLCLTPDMRHLQRLDQ